MREVEKLAGEYAWAESGGHKDRERVQAAFEEGFSAARELALDRVKLSRFTIILSDDGITRGYLKACEDIDAKIQQLGEREA